MRVKALCVVVMLWSAMLVADDHSVAFDSHAEFSTFRTFTMHEGTVNGQRPELNNPPFLKKVRDAIRAELVAHGLKESSSVPDIVVEYSIEIVDYSVGPGGRASVVVPIATPRGQRVGSRPPAGYARRCAPRVARVHTSIPIRHR